MKTTSTDTMNTRTSEEEIQRELYDRQLDGIWLLVFTLRKHSSEGDLPLCCGLGVACTARDEFSDDYSDNYSDIE